MRVRDSVAFITGANRGIGLAFAQALLAEGAKKVYAAALKPSSSPVCIRFAWTSRSQTRSLRLLAIVAT